MRKAFETNKEALPEIKPVEELEIEEIIPEGIESPQKPNYKHEEVFINENNIKETEDSVNDIEEEPVK